jgi:hypothetical protein
MAWTLGTLGRARDVQNGVDDEDRQAVRAEGFDPDDPDWAGET